MSINNNNKFKHDLFFPQEPESERVYQRKDFTPVERRERAALLAEIEAHLGNCYSEWQMATSGARAYRGKAKKLKEQCTADMEASRDEFRPSNHAIMLCYLLGAIFAALLWNQVVCA